MSVQAPELQSSEELPGYTQKSLRKVHIDVWLIYQVMHPKLVAAVLSYGAALSRITALYRRLSNILEAITLVFSPTLVGIFNQLIISSISSLRI
jgi:hypothetical protein